MNRLERALRGLSVLMSILLAGIAIHAAGFGVADTTLYSALTVALGVGILFLSEEGSAATRAASSSS